MSEPRPTCPACGAVVSPDARFCEACGTALAPAVPAGPPPPPAPSDAVPPPPPTGPAPQQPAAPACAECGGVIDADGYCTSCGAKAPSPRDHLEEQPQRWVGAVCDVGFRRTRNEDGVAVAAGVTPGEFAVLVVCDGVSAAEASDVASLAAARAARDVLVRTRTGASGDEVAEDAAARQVAAADAAQRAVVQATPHDHGESPASCTYVAVLLEAGHVSAGVVGDSRAYWLPDVGDARHLTTDDSMAAEMMAAGQPRAEAEAGPFAHTITRWLGIDSPGHTPRVTTSEIDGPGWVLACSDGLWNYCSPAADLGVVVREVASAAGGDPLATASGLVDWANARGGHDNITVALARIDAAAAPANDPGSKG